MTAGYCDGKSEGYYLHSDFSTRIRVKVNAPQLLESELRRRGFVPEARARLTRADAYQTELVPSRPGKLILGIGGGVCDVYQPAEEQVRITRRLLEIAADFALPVALLTKSVLALRDLDLLKRINKQSHTACNFTITLADDRCQRLFEPGASSTSERFEAIRTLRQAGIHSGIYFSPILPLIGDTAENMKSVYDRAIGAGAEFVWCGGLTLKPGRNKQEFFSLLRGGIPSLLPAYERLYGNDDRYGTPDPHAARALKLPDPECRGFPPWLRARIAPLRGTLRPGRPPGSKPAGRRVPCCGSRSLDGSPPMRRFPRRELSILPRACSKTPTPGSSFPTSCRAFRPGRVAT